MRFIIKKISDQKRYFISIGILLVAALEICLINRYFVETAYLHAYGDSANSTEYNIKGDISSLDVYADFIQMYGSPQEWDDEKNMSVDLNNDGVFEQFSISLSRTDGILLGGGAERHGKWRSMNFWTADVFEFIYQDLIREKMQSGASNLDQLWPWSQPKNLNFIKPRLLEDSWLQVICCDLDADGVKEVLISVGKKDDMRAAIYKLSRVGELPFSYCGDVILRGKTIDNNQ